MSNDLIFSAISYLENSGAMWRNVAKIALTAVMLLMLLAACTPAAPPPPTYGAKVYYTPGQPLNYPDVTLEFVGKRETPVTTSYPRRMTFYDFKVYQGSQAQLVSWSAGAGDIGPTRFDLGGNSFALELAMSDKLGPLAEDELVLWREVSSATSLPTPTRR